jgi:hypothetical protein
VPDEVRDELEPVGGAIEDVSIGKRDEDPSGELGKGGFGDVSGDPGARGVTAGPPDAAIDLDRDLGSGPGEVGSEGGRFTRSQALLFLEGRPVVPHRQDVLSNERKAWEGDQPLVGEGFLQMAGHRRGSGWDGDEPRS